MEMIVDYYGGVVVDDDVAVVGIDVDSDIVEGVVVVIDSDWHIAAAAVAVT